MILPARTVAPTACPSTSFREVRQNAQPTCGRLRGALVMTPAQPPRAPSTRALGMSYCLTEVFVNLYAASPWFRRRLSGFPDWPYRARPDQPRPATEPLE